MPINIDELLAIACSKGASDLHIKAGSYPFIRVNGELQPIIESQRLTQEDTLAMAFSIMSFARSVADFPPGRSTSSSSKGL